ncbi:hypothetical protein MYU51_019597 [Penicillium brevicompactum]|uniref:uncharacterized protein n=1 Tax=Penicillium brevicompactum TaxID=5074 RepID=UPI0025418719|nr:uncharacterized protein N7506_005510 [Penicillium brevicompactum]KAJ5337488.1 hypothetical protein N7506_005510 [Penicillium brevicompactum]
MYVALWTALLESGFLLAADFAAAEPFKFIAQRAEPSWTYIGCYSSRTGLNNKTSYTFQSYGWCLDRCIKTNAATFALTGGSDCLCGTELPPLSAKVAEGECNLPCWGFTSDMCGGNEFYSVYKTGLKSDVPTQPQSTTTSNVSNTQPTASATGDNESSRTEEKTQSTSKTGVIAGGVVGGVCGAVAIIGGVISFWQYKKRKVMAKYGIDAGGNGANTTPMSEFRFDGDYIPQRHQSNGSIDDYREFSCRGLHVTNPD